jgi:hypothetical protein
MIAFYILSFVFAALAIAELYRTCLCFYHGIKNEHYGMKSRGLCLIFNTIVLSLVSILTLLIA